MISGWERCWDATDWGRDWANFCDDLPGSLNNDALSSLELYGQLIGQGQCCCQGQSCTGQWVYRDRSYQQRRALVSRRLSRSNGLCYLTGGQMKSDTV